MAYKLLVIAPLVAALATQFPEVIPGPGLPSLAELGLTSKDLYTMTPAIIETVEGIEKRQTTRFPTCDTIDTGDIANFIACFNYLNGLGRKACEVKGGVTFCTAGNALVGGVNVGGGTTSSYCSDVALGLQWIDNNCNVNGQVGGSQAANGNSNLVVEARWNTN